MENNLENKAKFFAQYWGQRVLSIHNSTYLFVIQDMKQKDVSENDWLVLKPLSDISDEDAEQLSVRLGRVVSLQKVIQENSKDLVKEVVSNYSQVNMLWSLPSQFTDKARELGYLIDFNGLSTEELISRGWAVVSTNNLKTE